MTEPHTLDEIVQQQSLLRRRLDEEERALTNLAKRLWAQQESEKARLSRELHDGVGQLLTGLTRRLTRLAAEMPELTELSEIAELALSDVRQLSRMMSPTMLDDLGLTPALKWLCRNLFEHEDISIDVNLNADVIIPKDISILLFRISQESLVNCIKHSDATQVSLTLLTHHNVIRLDVADNGKGFDTSQVAAGIGLSSITDRAKAFDAEYSLSTAPGKGTRITIKAPL